MSPAANQDQDLPDPRANPYRDDIAADYLEGKVTAARFVAGSERRLGVACSPLMSKPVEGALQSSELLFGEDFTVYEEKDGWAWGQSETDGYVGYVPACGLGEASDPPTHRVRVPASHVYPEPHLKTPVSRANCRGEQKFCGSVPDRGGCRKTGFRRARREIGA